MSGSRNVDMNSDEYMQDLMAGNLSPPTEEAVVMLSGDENYIDFDDGNSINYEDGTESQTLVAHQPAAPPLVVAAPQIAAPSQPATRFQVAASIAPVPASIAPVSASVPASVPQPDIDPRIYQPRFRTFPYHHFYPGRDLASLSDEEKSTALRWAETPDERVRVAQEAARRQQAAASRGGSSRGAASAGGRNSSGRGASSAGAENVRGGGNSRRAGN